MPRRNTRQITSLQACGQLGLIFASYPIVVGIVFARMLLVIAISYP